MDSEEKISKVDFNCFDPECLHGAPDRSDTAITEPTLALVMEHIAIQGVSEELVFLEEFCRTNSKIASDYRCPLIILSMAADALYEKNFFNCRKYLRAMHFLDAFVLEGEDFLTALHAQGSNPEPGAGSPPSLQQFVEGMKSTGSVRSIYRDISTRVGCRCFHM